MLETRAHIVCPPGGPKVLKPENASGGPARNRASTEHSSKEHISHSEEGLQELLCILAVPLLVIRRMAC